MRTGAIGVFYHTFGSSVYTDNTYHCYYTAAVNMGPATSYGISGATSKQLLFVPFWYQSRTDEFTASHVDIRKQFHTTSWVFNGVFNTGFLYDPEAPRVERQIRLVSVVGYWPSSALATMKVAASLTSTVYEDGNYSSSILGNVLDMTMHRRRGRPPFFSVYFTDVDIDEMILDVRSSSTFTFNDADTIYPYSWYVKGELKSNARSLLQDWLMSEGENVFDDSVILV